MPTRYRNISTGVYGDAAGIIPTDMAAVTLQSAAGAPANGAAITLDGRSQSVTVSASGGIATIIPEWSFDAGSTWEIAAYVLVATGADAASITVAAAVSRYRFVVPAGATRLRARISAFVSGAITATAIERRMV